MSKSVEFRNGSVMVFYYLVEFRPVLAGPRWRRGGRRWFRRSRERATGIPAQLRPPRSVPRADPLPSLPCLPPTPGAPRFPGRELAEVSSEASRPRRSLKSVRLLIRKYGMDVLVTRRRIRFKVTIGTFSLRPKSSLEGGVGPGGDGPR